MIVAGFGCRHTATEDSFRSALSGFDARPDALATLPEKLAQLQPLADQLGLPLVPVDQTTLASQTTLTHSDPAHTAYATGSVAEAAALAAAGPGARLIGARHISQDRLATCALAIGEDR